jgi:flagellar brake protein
MSFLDTVPTPIQRLQAGGAWAAFRVSDPRQRELILRDSCRRDQMFSIGTPGGPTVQAVLWSIDDTTRALLLALPGGADDVALLRSLLSRRVPAVELWAAGYLQEAKLQFELPEPQLLSTGAQVLLQANLPRVLLRLPRRGTVRMRHKPVPGEPGPVAIFRHPLAQERRVRLSVLNISSSGCALWRPAEELPLPPGAQIRKVEMELDDEAIFFADLRVQHASAADDGSRGSKVGCAWQDLPAPAADTLQRWIRGGGRQRGLMSLDLD